MIAPCKGCTPPKRTLTCHDTCPEYLAWKQPLDEYNKQRINQSNADSYHIEWGLAHRKRFNDYKIRRHRP